MRFGVLGPLAVWTDDATEVAIPGRQVRALLADLLVHQGRPVSAERLVDDLWRGNVPNDPVAALQVRVSQLRRVLENAEAGGRGLVVSRSPGYLLRVQPETVDAVRFADLADRAARTGDPAVRASLLGEALALWRGPALADFKDDEFTRPVIARLEEQRLAVLEQQAEARLALGEHSSLVAILRGLVDEHPYRERFRAAHMRALYRSGRQGEALESYDDLQRRLADELGLDPGLELARLRQAILERDPAEAPAATLAAGSAAGSAVAAARPSSNLPVSLTELIGREEALDEVRSLLLTGRLVTLTGTGGVGKTRVAVEAARGLQGSFTDGVWLVELAALDASEDVAENVMAVLDIRDASAAGELSLPPDRLAAALADRKLLLVLDSCEHLVTKTAELTDQLLQRVPGLRILATSREPLGLGSEVVWEVPPLKLPAADVGHEALAGSPAVRLFAARAAAAAREFTLDPATVPAVAELCRRLDGIPLALELAAPRVRALGVHGLVERLNDRFRLLTGGRHDVPARQQTLAAMIDWSWQLLSESERIVLRRLAVHAGGCTMDAAEAVCAGDGVAAGDVLGLVARLVDRSLVVADTQADGQPRYRLLESVSAYCADQLRETGELAPVRLRHARHYLQLAERAAPQLYGQDQARWLRRLDVETGNLRVAVDTAIRQGTESLALRLVDALAWYWFIRGRLAEACRFLAAALAAPGQPATALRARAEAWQVGMAALRGDKERSVAAALEPVLERFQGVDDVAGHARAEWFLSFAIIDYGDLATTEKLVDRAHEKFVACGDRWGEAATLSTRAKLAHVRGDLAALTRDAERSAELFRDLGDHWGVLQATDWLIGLAEMTCDYEKATRLSEEGLGMAEELALWPDVAARLSWLAWIAVQVGEYASAQDVSKRALRLAIEHGYPTGEVFPRICLAIAARRDGKLDIAEERLKELENLARSQESGFGPVLYLSMVLSELGRLAAQRGDTTSAMARQLEAFDIVRRQAGPRDLAWAIEGMAHAQSVDGQHQLAAELLGAAWAMRRSTGLPVAAAERDGVELLAAAARRRLGEEAFAAAFEAGAERNPAEVRSLLVK